jgi:hypothetical protein
MTIIIFVQNLYILFLLGFNKNCKRIYWKILGDSSVLLFSVLLHFLSPLNKTLVKLSIACYYIGVG